ncbi:effector-associated domain EAD1-containing protein [Nostoc sp. ATCC 53789]|uniref:effector-associated domain EAD1-containing protein n=1 Tax=Nostoc sp. ATCC 53789 TaxID=76335 RepID=UPI001ADB08F3|nr:effector-associated domain EAD1-containing protein [Nostoc sp. ATCC 53789]
MGREPDAEKIIIDVSTLLWQYVEYHSPWKEQKELERTQQLTALNFINPQVAKNWLKQAPKNNDSRASSEEKQWLIAIRQEIKQLPNLQKINTKNKIEELLRMVLARGKKDFYDLVNDIGLNSNKDFVEATLVSANFTACNLTGLNLRSADLNQADLSYTNLSHVNLSNARLSFANLKGANLTDADLNHADLSNAYLVDANLLGANLKNAIVTNAKFANNQTLSEAMKRDLIQRGAVLDYEVDPQLFDVFLSHNSQDRSQVRLIAQKLRQHRLKPWLDEEQIRLGERFSFAVEQALENSKTIAVFIGKLGVEENSNYEMLIFVHQQKNIPIIPVFLPGVDPDKAKLPKFLINKLWLRFEHGIDDTEAFKKLVLAINRQEFKTNLKTLSDDQRRRLEQQKNSFEQSYELQSEKIARLRKAWVIETELSRKFQYEHLIKNEETELKKLTDRLDEIEKQLQSAQSIPVISEPKSIQQTNTSLSGQQRKELQLALIDAFPNTASLEQMLAFELDINLRAIADEGSLQDIVFKLIQTTIAQGWVKDLVYAACNSNPGNQQLRAIARGILPNHDLETSSVFSPNISQKQTNQQQKILILTAIPHELRLDREIREIEEAIRRATNRDLFEIRIRTAVRPQDIRRVIAEEQPQIVHFCGHGLEDGSLLLEDDGGNSKPVAPKGLASLFKLHADYVKCVLLNACYSEKPAVAISQYINYAIGMNQPIEDKAAIAFAQGFYDGLGYKNLGNQDVFQRAFDEGMVAIEMENIAQGSIPVLKKTRAAKFAREDQIFS